MRKNDVFLYHFHATAQLTFTCSKSTSWVVSFYTPRKHQKILSFLVFSGGIEKKNSDMKWVKDSFIKYIHLQIPEAYLEPSQASAIELL